MMLRAGKNVLVEKPTAVTYEEAKILYDEAKVGIAYELSVHIYTYLPVSC